MSGDKVHTSNISVAILPLLNNNEIKINPKDIERKTTRSGGKGGQNVNKIESCVILKHIPSGITVRSESQRTQNKNEEIGYKILYSKLKKLNDDKLSDARRQDKKEQHGTGTRSDKDRVYIEKRNEIVDYNNNLRYPLDEWIKGKWKWII